MAADGNALVFDEFVADDILLVRILSCTRRANYCAHSLDIAAWLSQANVYISLLTTLTFLCSYLFQFTKQLCVLITPLLVPSTECNLIAKRTLELWFQTSLVAGLLV